MILLFSLTMPNKGSWNGQWSSEGNAYLRTRNIPDKRAFEILNNKESNNFYYRWEDGWGANVNVKRIYSQEAVKARRISKGFCGYDWMIDSIIKYSKIFADEEDYQKYLDEVGVSTKNK
jgi:hypothetical protein